MAEDEYFLSSNWDSALEMYLLILSVWRSSLISIQSKRVESQSWNFSSGVFFLVDEPEPPPPPLEPDPPTLGVVLTFCSILTLVRFFIAAKELSNASCFWMASWELFALILPLSSNTELLMFWYVRIACVAKSNPSHKARRFWISPSVVNVGLFNFFNASKARACALTPDCCASFANSAISLTVALANKSVAFSAVIFTSFKFNPAFIASSVATFSSPRFLASAASTTAVAFVIPILDNCAS